MVALGTLVAYRARALGDATATILLSRNERRAAEDRRDCYWLYVVTNCNAEPNLRTFKDPTQLPLGEVVKVQHYTILIKDIGTARA